MMAGRSLVLWAALLAGAGQAKTIQVAPGPGAAEAVQTALIEAAPGDTVLLAAGRYAFTDGLSLDVKDVTLAGVGEGKTILSFKGQKSAAEGLLITADGSVVRDLTIHDAKGDGIKWKGVNGVHVHDVTVEWPDGPKATNGGYGVYPVASRNILIERVTVRGASDAGIYVGQSRDIIVQDNIAEYNVAGIEIENSMFADVAHNVVRKNAGGILVFDLPNLPQMGGHSTRVFGNRISDNDTPNFAAPGNVVAEVPTGTGVMVMANRNVHVFDNEISGNGSAAVMIVAYKKPFDSAGYNPLPRDVVVRGNRLRRNGFAPAFPGGAELAKAVGGTLPPLLWDGAQTYLVDGKPVTEVVRIGSDVPALTLNLPSATADMAAARPAPVQLRAAGLPPEPAPVAVELRATR
ncbi:right-handed parallel beta-helix repeat-containing protein [Sandaracinobacteroides saxicola]|uniref:Right-handed parallel beta-helix repeat-containing protein n=2 Tax=Sandaracinobacteroides saxicola TaxID=2759707 RepID=A0A7G5IMW3_9SPHN|nr:right-handed parallel beta-helix repeat-containing protein [Sandaracinobacteroides saxicola]